MAHQFLLKVLFCLVARFPRVLWRLRVVLAWLAWHASPHLRSVCRANGRAILGPGATGAQLAAYGRGVLAEFLRFVADIGMARGQSRAALLGRVSAIDGHDSFLAAMSLKRGLIIATCHAGNFEVGAAAVADRVSETHILFQGDAQSGFERLRTRLHQQIGLTEAHIEDGLRAWVQLRDALGRGGAVLIQADRCMPGQDGSPTRFLHGRIEMPDGPAKLARLSGAPILPIVCLVEENGGNRLVIDTPIDPLGRDAGAFDLETRQRLARFFSRIVGKHPAQWHTLHRAFVEDDQQ